MEQGSGEWRADRVHARRSDLVSLGACSQWGCDEVANILNPWRTMRPPFFSFFEPTHL